ncbi:hypothetical protein Pint_06140 [Pistacia integerrima]|uniref:Uncharacterized protein n=1 Tax=Pistacia integerrima TaxID=434235 RepID=A0ACC0Z572_9ROSI|nr:hypothetical protein Pint_06140 [Pistacia integerrima]
MEDWDQETLEKVVESKKNEYNQNKPTEIVWLVSESLYLFTWESCLVFCSLDNNLGCSMRGLSSSLKAWANAHGLQMHYLSENGVCKHFLEAVEKKQYGWFWVCPNGGKDCHYRHALPPGYVLKSQMKALLDEETEKIAVEDDIENQRAKLTVSTPMTPELFMQWRKKKMEEREAGLAAQRADRAKNDRMSGRELFLSDSSLFVDDAEAYEKYQRDEEPGNTENKVKDGSAGPSTSSTAVAGSEEILPDDDDDDELDLDELNELEASLSRTSIQIREPGIEASS